MPKPVEGKTYRLFIRDFIVPMRIGIHPREQQRAQRVRVNLDLEVARGSRDDRIETVVSYDDLIAGIEAIARQKHVALAETVADRILGMALEFPLVTRATVRLEKLEPYGLAESVGVEIEGHRPAGKPTTGS